MSITVDFNSNMKKNLSSSLNDTTKNQKSKPPPISQSPGLGRDINQNKIKKNSNFILKTEISKNEVKISNNENFQLNENEKNRKKNITINNNDLYRNNNNK